MARTFDAIATEAREAEERLRTLATTAWDQNNGDDPEEQERLDAAEIILDIADIAETLVNRARDEACARWEPWTGAPSDV